MKKGYDFRGFVENVDRRSAHRRLVSVQPLHKKKSHFSPVCNFKTKDLSVLSLYRTPLRYMQQPVTGAHGIINWDNAIVRADATRGNSGSLEYAKKVEKQHMLSKKKKGERQTWPG